MTEREAKEIIRNDPGGNIFKRLDAIEVAENVLGEDCTTGDIMNWAEREADDGKRVSETIKKS